MSCFLCDKDENLKSCSDCGKIESCPSHLQYHNRCGMCSKWCVKEVEGAGRGLFAAIDIQAGEVVVADWPVVEGPLPTTGGVCLVCFSDQGCMQCKQCSLKVCRSRTRGCQASHQQECSVLKAAKKANLSTECIYTCIAAVRLMKACERDPACRGLVDPLMDHREIHKQDEQSGWKEVVKFLSKQGFCEENIERSLGLLQTNGVTSQSSQGEPRGHALYPIFSIVNNSCVSNTRHGKKEDAFCLIATVPIKAGEEITTSYKSPTQGNIARQLAFKSLWNFQCSCIRCTDPTELGTFSSSLRCPDCTGCCSALVQTQPDVEAEWECEKCAKRFSFTFVQEKTRKLQQMVESTGHTIDKLETLASILVRVVTPHHFLLMQVKRMLLLMYGNCASHRLETLSPKQIDRKIQLCREYIEVFSVLEPGLTKWKARVCEELARALVTKEGRPGVEVCKLIGESGKCRQLDSQEEQAAFTSRMAQLMGR